MIKLSKVSFSYGKKRALTDVSLTLGTGVYGLLGPNGAGKTTLMNVLSTLDEPSNGVVRVLDVDATERRGRKIIRSRLGYLPQRFELMESSSLLRNVRYAAWAHGMRFAAADQASRQMIHEVGLDEMAHASVRSLSGGMRQRAGIACAMVTQPDLLILDEPTVGLDPLQRIDIRRFLSRYGKGHTVLVSTHLVDDLAAMADHVIVLNAGRIVMQGSMKEFASLGEVRKDDRISVWEAGYQQLIQGPTNYESSDEHSPDVGER